jgi:hypothetical protein
MKKILMILAVICFLFTGIMPANAQEKPLIPAELDAQKPGTDFWLTFHPAHDSRGANHGIRIYVVSEKQTRVTMEIPGKGFSKSILAKPYESVCFNLGADIAQCYQKEISIPPLPQAIFKGFGIHVFSDEPVVCYGISDFSLTVDAFQVIPTCDLGCEYVAASWGDYTQECGGNYYPSYMSVVAAYDDTEVELTLGGTRDCYTPAPDRLDFGDKAKKKMNKGDVWLLGVMGDYSDLTGTHVKSDKPVAVISGNYRTTIPSTYASRDYLIQQNAPFYSLGKEYHVTPIHGRKNASLIRVFAAEDDATIYRDGDEWARIPKVGGAENEGWISRRARSNEDPDRLDPVVISSDKRIAVSQYNPTVGDDGMVSDPFMMRLSPKGNFSKKCRVNSFLREDEYFDTDLINLVYQTDEFSNIPDYINLCEYNNNELKRMRLNQVVNNSGKEFENQTGARKWKTVTIEITDKNSVYMIESDEPIMCYLYGNRTNSLGSTYGLPIGGEFKDLSIPDSIAPVFEYYQECDGSIEGYLTDMPREDVNRSNLYSFELIDEESYNYKIDTDSKNFIPGMMSEIEFEAYVIDKEQEAAFSLIVTDRARNKDTLRVYYSPDATAMEPRNATFPPISVGDTCSQKTLTFINESGSDVIIDSVYIVSEKRNSGFSIPENGEIKGTRLAARQLLDIDFVFNADKIPDDYKSENGIFRDTVAVAYTRKVGMFDSCRYERRFSTLSVNLNLDFPPVGLISPEFDSETAPDPQFIWQKSELAESYLLQVSGNDDFTDLFISKEIEADTFCFSEKDLEPGKTYFWRVRAIKGEIISAWSDVWRFTVGLIVPENIYPEKDARNISPQPKITWKKCRNADYYFLELSEEADFLNTISRELSYSTEYTYTTPLAPETEYYRRVAAMTDGKISDWSEVWKFKTGKSSGIEENTTGNLQIVPNPAKEMIHIEFTEWFDYAHQTHVEVPALRQALIPRVVKIYDLQGNLVIESREPDIDVSGLAPGMYLAVITSGEEVYQTAFLKE